MSFTERDLDFLGKITEPLSLDNSRQLSERERVNEAYDLLRIFYASLKSSDETRDAIIEAFFARPISRQRKIEIRKGNNLYLVRYSPIAVNNGNHLHFYNGGLNTLASDSEKLVGTIKAGVAKVDLSQDTIIEDAEIKLQRESHVASQTNGSILFKQNSQQPNAMSNTLNAAQYTRRLFAELGR